jgi:hypothetical protein
LHTPLFGVQPGDGAGQSLATAHFRVQTLPLLGNAKQMTPSPTHASFSPHVVMYAPPADASTPASTPGVVPSQMHC